MLGASVGLTAQALYKRFATVTAVDRLTFAIEPGEIFALLGPNGAGKTTVVRMLTGIIQPDEGTLRFRAGGWGAASLPPSWSGYLPEDRGLYREVPVLETLTYFGVLRGMGRGAAGRAGRAWLDRFGLGDRADEKLDALSKGNQQKIQFIAAVLHEPSLVILDEPFSGLDPINQELFVETIRDLRRAGATVLLSAHQMALVERLADRMLLMSHGRQVLAGTLDQIRRAETAGQRLTFEMDRFGDTQPLRDQPGVVDLQLDGPTLTVMIRDGVLLDDVLAAVTRCGSVRSVRSEQLSLHDIYVSAVAAAGGPSPGQGNA